MTGQSQLDAKMCSRVREKDRGRGTDANERIVCGKFQVEQGARFQQWTIRLAGLEHQIRQQAGQSARFGVFQPSMLMQPSFDQCVADLPAHPLEHLAAR